MKFIPEEICKALGFKITTKYIGMSSVLDLPIYETAVKGVYITAYDVREPEDQDFDLSNQGLLIVFGSIRDGEEKIAGNFMVSEAMLEDTEAFNEEFREFINRLTMPRTIPLYVKHNKAELDIMKAVINAQILIDEAEIKARKSYVLNLDFQLQCEVLRKKIETLKKLL